MARHAKPTWWLLYVIGVLLVGVVGLVEMTVQAAVVRKVLEGLDVVAGFGFMGVWVRLNRSALELDREFTALHPQLPRPDSADRTAFGRGPWLRDIDARRTARYEREHAHADRRPGA